MNIKKIAYSIMTLSFVLIISGCVSSFLIGLRQDRQETYYRMNLVYDEFEVFSANTSVFEEFRDDLYNISFSNLYYDTMPMNDYTIKNKLSNYERIVDELEKNMENLKKLCNNMYYPESNANSQCVNYKSIYEQVVNYFVSDIHFYNDNIEEYNEYQISLGSMLRLRTYHIDRDYIDYNEDGTYDGKEE